MELTQLLYIDPAATSVLLTSLTAIVVAVGASAIVIWRKLKKKVDKTLNKDPNANKEVEDDIVILDEEATVTPAEDVAPVTEEAKPVEEVAPATEEAAPTVAPSEETVEEVKPAKEAKPTAKKSTTTKTASTAKKTTTAKTGTTAKKTTAAKTSTTAKKTTTTKKSN